MEGGGPGLHAWLLVCTLEPCFLRLIPTMFNLSYINVITMFRKVAVFVILKI